MCMCCLRKKSCELKRGERVSQSGLLIRSFIKENALRFLLSHSLHQTFDLFCSKEQNVSGLSPCQKTIEKRYLTVPFFYGRDGEFILKLLKLIILDDDTLSDAPRASFFDSNVRVNHIARNLNVIL